MCVDIRENSELWMLDFVTFLQKPGSKLCAYPGEIELELTRVGPSFDTGGVSQ